MGGNEKYVWKMVQNFNYGEKSGKMISFGSMEFSISLNHPITGLEIATDHTVWSPTPTPLAQDAIFKGCICKFTLKSRVGAIHRALIFLFKTLFSFDAKGIFDCTVRRNFQYTVPSLGELTP